MNTQVSIWIKGVIATAGAWLWLMIEPALPYGMVCTLMVLADVVSARRLAQRIRKIAPRHHNLLKFNSARFGQIFKTLSRIYAVLLLAAMVQGVIVGESFELLKFVAGSICFWQGISILENEASCNARPWARILRRILIDKTERHLGITLDELRKNDGL